MSFLKTLFSAFLRKRKTAKLFDRRALLDTVAGGHSRSQPLAAALRWFVA